MKHFSEISPTAERVVDAADGAGVVHRLRHRADHVARQVGLDGDDREFGKNRTLSFASSCNQFIVFSMDERKWRKLFDKQIGIL